jgi:hypothetical protein
VIAMRKQPRGQIVSETGRRNVAAEVAAEFSIRWGRTVTEKEVRRAGEFVRSLDRLEAVLGPAAKNWLLAGPKNIQETRLTEWSLLPADKMKAVYEAVLKGQRLSAALKRLGDNLPPTPVDPFAAVERAFNKLTDEQKQMFALWARWQTQTCDDDEEE